MPDWGIQNRRRLLARSAPKPILLDNRGPLNPNDPDLWPVMRKLQGNILKGHGRDFSAFVLFRLGGRPEAARRGLARLADRIITSAFKQHTEAQQYRTLGIPGATFGAVYLAASGYRALGLSDEELRAAFPETPGHGGILSNFREGMRAHGDELNDPPASDWDPAWRGDAPNRGVDGMVMLADDHEATLSRETRRLIEEISSFATVAGVERAASLTSPLGRTVEHFGFAMACSEPALLNSAVAPRTDNWNPTAPLRLALVEDRLSPTPQSYGSYLVFRKLEQNVRAFRTQEIELASALGLTEAGRDRAAAMIVGRHRDGTPLALTANEAEPNPLPNNFNYNGDPNGLRCPFHAHIRKANPRGELARQVDPSLTAEAAERPRQIVRRSVPYGAQTIPPETANDPETIAQLPSEGVGLFFMCFQSSVANQFAYVQSRWLNEQNFVRIGTGADPIAGQRSRSSSRPQMPQVWPTTYDTLSTEPFAFRSCVRLKGGEFFFAPGIPFFRSLSDS